MTISLADHIYNGLRKKLIHGEFMPGTLLSENELAAEFGMSRTPVRTALSRLETEGYVVSLKNRGILVKEVSGKEILDMFEVIVSFQIYTAEIVTQRESGFDVAELEEELRKQQKATEAGDYAAYLEHTHQFTSIYLSAANNQSMLTIMDSFKDKLTMAAIVNYKRTPHQKHFSASRMNEELMEAIKAGDYDRLKQRVLQGFAALRERAFREGRF
ncbi:DNA-binding GntR family transcriptional regulator [Paenibacillus phyllosphaerae]|uniref:DNA-binding GntR family transcriptional regulator n=1 Tax=Paenibacillus phyllosphaerae TaxID=274593 RepID=A0A7W5AXR2_9BACL|nr:GntR family transcriptional regulator [Paenibacillus phyllosphaerae]MBB3110715.1 DNA-binding GntR family transcriptional regulator [Paenibacillus phyllosphaerae]